MSCPIIHPNMPVFDWFIHEASVLKLEIMSSIPLSYHIFLLFCLLQTENLMWSSCVLECVLICEVRAGEQCL